MRALRLLSYLAPSIPESLFAIVAARLRQDLGSPVELLFETRLSGPSPEEDPFATGRADVAFVCGPSYPLLRAAGSSVKLLPAALVFADARAGGRPVYFSDVVVRRDHAARSFADLRGAVWAFNDRASRSGWGNMVARLGSLQPPEEPGAFFGKLLHSGSHLASLDSVAGGAADAAAIDSNTLWLARRSAGTGHAGLRVLESWGPMPIQPLLASARLSAGTRDRIVRSLLTLREKPVWAERLATCGVTGFAPVEESDYAEVRPVRLARPEAASRGA